MEKSRIITIILCLGLSFGAWAQDGRLLRFSQPQQEIDTVRFDSGVITLRYQFENVSGREVSVLEVHSTCGCFTGEVSARNLKPGQKAVLTAVFDPKSLHGPQNRHLTVVASADGENTVLSSIGITGYVLRDASEGEIRYAEDLGQGLRTDTSVNSIAKDGFGDFVFSIPLYNDTDKELSIEVSAPRRVKLYAPATIGPHSREDLRGIYNALWKRLGSEVLETLQIKVDGVPVAPLQIKGTIY